MFIKSDKEEPHSNADMNLHIELGPLLGATTGSNEHEGTVQKTIPETSTATTAHFENGLANETDQEAESLLERMRDADATFMGLPVARTRSVLPTHVMQGAVYKTESKQPWKPERAQPMSLDEPEHAAEPAGTSFSAYLMLILAVTALSSIGPLLDLQSDCTPVMKIYWRMSATALLLLPIALCEVLQEGLPRLSFPQLATLVMATACYATMCTGFAVALEYTTVGNATILVNGQAILILIGKCFAGHTVLVIEGAGAVTAFVGAPLQSRLFRF